MSEKQVRVGVGVMIIRKGKILLGKRKGSHGEGCWAPPGGHLEFNESIEKCAKREVKEETDLDLEDIEEVCFTNDVFDKEERHYVTLFVKAKNAKGDPKVMEPEKCMKWEWFSWDSLPEPLFIPVKNLIKGGFILR